MSQTPASAVTLRWVAGLVLLVVVLRVVPLALANHHALQRPALALNFRTDHPEALVAQATYFYAAGNGPVAARLARQGLAADPFNGRGYRVVAQATGTTSSQAATLQLMQVALARAPLDFHARYWLIEQAEMRGSAGEALSLYDRVLRLEPASSAEVFPAMSSHFSQLLSSGQPVGAWLKDAPWRTAMLGYLAQQPGDDAAADMVFRQAKAAAGLGPKEEAAWVERYVRAANWPAAAARWRELTGRTYWTGTEVTNGDFERESGLPPFGWDIRSSPGVDAAVDMAGTGHVLRIDFLGQRSAFSNVSQLLLLPAGRYVLGWRSRGDGFRSARGMQWTLHCAPPQQTHLLATQHFPQSQDDRWIASRQEFAVPTGCQAQWLRLVLDARIAAETEAYGTVMLDDVEIKTAVSVPPVRS